MPVLASTSLLVPSSQFFLMNALESCMLSLNSSKRELMGWVQHYSSSMLRNSLLLRDFDPSLSPTGIIEVPKQIIGVILVTMCDSLLGKNSQF